MVLLPPPCEWGRQFPIRKILGDNSGELVKIDGKYVTVKGYLLTYHDLHHLEASCLERVRIGKHWVSGIHGVNKPIFHDSPIIPEYDGMFDEMRVSFHHWTSRPSLFSTLKLFMWMIWLVSLGINPVAVLIRHMRVIKHRENFYQLANKMELVSSTDECLKLGEYANR